MAYRERRCWVSRESTNNDHVYHIDRSCPYKRMIYPENLKETTVRKALSKGFPPCSFCASGE